MKTMLHKTDSYLSQPLFQLNSTAWCVSVLSFTQDIYFCWPFILHGAAVLKGLLFFCKSI